MFTTFWKASAMAPHGTRQGEHCIMGVRMINMFIQPVVIYGTTRHIAIQPVIQPVVTYGTAVQTVRLLRF